MGSCGQQRGGDAILFWNEVALEAHRRDFTFTGADGEDEADAATDRRGLRPEHAGMPAASRILAMVHLAIYDAWHALSPTLGAAYLDGQEAPPEVASADAAVAGAAFAVLSGLYVRQHDLFESKCRQHLAWLSDAGVPAAAMTAGYQHGRAIGLAMLEARAFDGAGVTGCYAPGAAPGLFRPDPFAAGPPLGATWGDVEPFGIDTLAVLCNSIKPPWDVSVSGGFLATPSYCEDLAEVAGLGIAAPAAGRSAEQTAVGLFWAYDGSRNIGTAPRLYNQCVRAISAKCRLPPAHNALLFALINMAMADAGIVAWFGKFRFRVWRPVHGVREGATRCGLSDPRPKAGASTAVACDWSADPLWRPLGIARTVAPGRPYFTPPSPAYPSGHSTMGTACFDVVFRFLRQIGMTAAAVRQLTFTVQSDELSGAFNAASGRRPCHTRTLTLAQAIRENALGRLYLGANWRAALVEGVRLGYAVASELAAAGRGPAASLIGSSEVDAHGHCATSVDTDLPPSPLPIGDRIEAFEGAGS